MHQVAVVAFVAGGVLFLSAQWPLLWPRRPIRWALTVLALGLIFFPVTFDGLEWIGGSSGLVIALVAFTVRRWGNQVWYDMAWRESDGLPQPVKGSGGSTALNPVFIALYRKRMFHEQYSRDLIIAQGHNFPMLTMTVDPCISGNFGMPWRWSMISIKVWKGGLWLNRTLTLCLNGPNYSDKPRK